MKAPLGLCLFMVTGMLNASPSEPIVADSIMHSGRILTVNKEFDIVEALAIHDGKIMAVGDSESIQQLSGEATQLLDLNGRTVIPGFIDAHSHPTVFGMHIIWPDLSTARSLADMLRAVAKEVRNRKPGDWITNSRIWNEEKLVERRNPTRWDLDSVSPENPVFLSRGHLGIVNSAALKALGVSKNTPDPEGGTFERDPETGELTGRVYETAMDPFRQALPHLTLEQIMRAQRQSYREMAAAGITSVRSAGFGAGSGAVGADELRGFLALKRAGELALRTSVTIRVDPNRPIDELEEFLHQSPVASGLGDEMLKIWGIKLVADGGTDLAFLRTDYRNRPHFRGQLGGSYENFVAVTRLCSKYGWRVATHALGDAAIDFVLDVYEAVNAEQSIVGDRWSIEHGYFLHPEHYARIRKLGLILHPQTWHLYNIHRNFVVNYPEPYPNMTHPYRTLIDREILIAGGMDWHIEKPSDMFFYLWVELTRQVASGEVVGPEQHLSREEALRLHTIWAAHSTFEESLKGSLEAGKLADLVVLSDNYLTVPLDSLKGIRPLLTMVGGTVVFQADDAPRFQH